MLGHPAQPRQDEDSDSLADDDWMFKTFKKGDEKEGDLSDEFINDEKTDMDECRLTDTMGLGSKGTSYTTMIDKWMSRHS